MNCNHVQIQSDRQRMGLLGSREAAELQEHLEACETCRTYHELAEKTEETMQQHSISNTFSMTWEQLLAQANRQRRKQLINVITAPIVPVLFVGCAWATGKMQLLDVGLMVPILVGLTLLNAWRRLGPLRVEGPTQEQLSAACRRDLEREHWRATLSAVLGVGLGFFALAAGVFVILVADRTALGAALIATAVAGLAWACYEWFGRRARLQQQIQTLFSE